MANDTNDDDDRDSNNGVGGVGDAWSFNDDDIALNYDGEAENANANNGEATTAEEERMMQIQNDDDGAAAGAAAGAGAGAGAGAAASGMGAGDDPDPNAANAADDGAADDLFNAFMAAAAGDDADDDNDGQEPAAQPGAFPDELGGAAPDLHPPLFPPRPTQPTARSFKLPYTPLSLLSASLLILYALRTRGQSYLALTYLTSSKLAYILLGNAVVSLTTATFRFITQTFLNGLRQAETESISESFRWNVTETCIALTIFRSEVDVNMGGMFLILVMGKCLHWAVELRGGHLRMTEEVFYFADDNDGGNAVPTNNNSSRISSGGGGLKHWFGTLLTILAPQISKSVSSTSRRIPGIPKNHVKFVLLTSLLLIGDFMSIFVCALAISRDGPSVHILFGFEAAILATSALSTLASYGLHVLDGVVGVLQRWVDPGHGHGLGLYEDAAHVTTTTTTEEGGGETADGEEVAAAAPPRPPPPPPTSTAKLVNSLSMTWRDHRATLSFTIELAVHALRFLFYLLFFAIVFTYYGMPINIFREVYVSYQQLRRRLTAFAKYRRLTANMSERFESVKDEEELDEVGRTCIICRDAMDAVSGSCKKLPGCGHCFHGHCLREWLVQQQSCPTCRGDITANEARVRAEKVRAEAAAAAEVVAAAAAAAAAEAEAAAAGAETAAVPPTAAAPQRPPASHASPPAATDLRARGAAAANSAGAIAPPGPSPISLPSQPTAAASEPSPAGATASGTPPIVPATTPPGTTADTSSSGLFPCLYRVTYPSGATVYRDCAAAPGSGTATTTTSNVLRTVPTGKIILCTELRWGGSGVGGGDGMMMLRMPDGWVAEKDLKRLIPLIVPASPPDLAFRLGAGVGVQVSS